MKNLLILPVVASIALAAVIGANYTTNTQPRNESENLVLQAKNIMKNERDSARYLHLSDLAGKLEQTHNFTSNESDLRTKNTVSNALTLIRGYESFAKTNGSDVPYSLRK